MKRILAVLLLLGCLGGCCACAPQERSVVGYYFDTVITVTASCPQEVLDGVLSICAELDTRFDRTDPNSEVWKLNHANGAPVAVSEDMRNVLLLAEEIHRMSDGAFDITIAPVTELWDFHSDTPDVPDAAQLRAAVERVDGSCVQIDGATVTLRDGVTIDLGGIAKGYIADRLKAYLMEQGVESACINLGGNILTIGTKPNGEPWRVGIRDPKGGPNDVIEVVSANDCAVVTSGTYERCFYHENVLYHHILDPKTGLPVRTETASVTVIGDSAAVADALSTACFVLDAEQAQRLAETYRVTLILHEGPT